MGHSMRDVFDLIKVFYFAIICASCYAFENDVAREQSIGRRVHDFSLIDAKSEMQWSLASESDNAQATILFIAGTQCPVANLYLPVLAQIQEKYKAKNLKIAGINAIGHDTMEDVRNHAREYRIIFPMLKDTDGAVCRSLLASRTTEVILIDARGIIRYRGRIDDRYERGLNKPKATLHYLVDAIDSILSDSRVKIPITEVVGCPIPIKDQASPAKTESSAVTFAEHIAPILWTKCASCHRTGQIGPFSLFEFDEAKHWSTSIREVVVENIMPPWSANPKVGHFKNDRSLSKIEYDLLIRWIDEGCHAGDLQQLPPMPVFPSDWVIGTPHQVLTMNDAIEIGATIPKGGVPYKYAWAGEDFKEDKWVTAAEVRPGARDVVHHIIVYIVPNDVDMGIKNNERPATGLFDLFGSPFENLQQLGAFVPGDQAYVFPKGLARKIPKDSRLLFEIHYTPNGKLQTDRSEVAMIFTDRKPDSEVLGSAALNWSFRIPPRKAAHPVEANYVVEQDMVLLSMNPHMHFRGRSFRYDLVRPDGKKEVLLDVSRYDFNWQSTYVLQEPKRISKDSKIVCKAVFDNSADNPFNPDPSKTVYWGDQTWDEMMLGYFEYFLAPSIGGE